VTVAFHALPGSVAHLVAVLPGPDLAAHGYVDAEYRATGSAVRYLADILPPDGRVDAAPGGEADFATRVAVRRPARESFSGTVVVEWLNVSSGDDVAPDYTYLAAEIVRRGHAWVGVSAQYVGVEGGRGTVDTPAAQSGNGLRRRNSDRYGDLCHPGDAYCYGIFDSIARAIDAPGGPLAGWPVVARLAVGESQSAFALTTFVNAVQPLTATFDGFLIHSRGGAMLPLGEPGCGIDLNEARHGAATRLRTDQRTPIITVVTETDVVSERLAFAPARQDDGPSLRLWEVAGAAHADTWQIGAFEELLGCPDPVNRGQQGYVVRAALHALDRWVRHGTEPPVADRLELDPGSPSGLALDGVGNARGGVRTPCVAAPVQVLSGLADPDASPLCALFGRTLPLPASTLATLYRDRADYLAAYAAATRAAIAAGFVLPEDRAAVLAESRPDLVT
jgi:hypothetical protein